MSTFRGLVLWVAAALVAGGLLGAPATAVSATPAEVGQWGPVLDFGVAAIHTALLHTGNVLVWRSGPQAMVWDPVTGAISQRPTSFPDDNLHCAALVVLADGRVIVMGGEKSKATAIFDPITQTWTQAPDMQFIRWYPSATVLGDGRVLVANGQNGGEGEHGEDVVELEVFDPANSTWSVLTGADLRMDLYAPMYLLPNGSVFQAAPWQKTWLLDVSARTWTAGPMSGWQTSGQTEAGAMYRPGQILRTGGSRGRVGAKRASSNTATIDMTTVGPQWAESAPMSFNRRRHNIVVLADGSVMAVGGTAGLDDDPTMAVFAGEIWDPVTKLWSTVASMSKPRLYHSTALLLADGRVLAAGGADEEVGADDASTAQVYSPPYLFKGPRPAITAAPARVSYASAFSIDTPDAGSVASVAIIRPGAVTHSYNMDQRYVPLSFTRTATGVTAVAPANGNWAPPGWYMLVIKNSAGVPSVSKWVRVGGAPAIQPPTGNGSAGPGGASPAPALPPSPGAVNRLADPGAGTPSGATGPITGSTIDPAGGSLESSAPPGSIAGVFARKRYRASEVRRRGLPVTVALAPWTDGAARVVRIRLYRLTDRRLALVTTVHHTLTEPDAFKLALRGKSTQDLRPGRYQVAVAMGTSRDQLGRATKRAIAVARG